MQDAVVTGIDRSRTARLRDAAEELKSWDASVLAGVRAAPPQAFDRAVHSTGFPAGLVRVPATVFTTVFTPCTPADSLLEAVSKAAEKAVSNDVILFSPAGSSFDMFQKYQHRGEMFRQAVGPWARTTNCSPAAQSSISSSRLMPISDTVKHEF